MSDSGLSKSQLTTLNQALAAVADAMQKCDLYERAGFNCSEFRVQLEDMEAAVKRAKATLFPESR